MLWIWKEGCLPRANKIYKSVKFLILIVQRIRAKASIREIVFFARNKLYPKYENSKIRP